MVNVLLLMQKNLQIIKKLIKVIKKTIQKMYTNAAENNFDFLK